jgi:hypothetical protein
MTTYLVQKTVYISIKVEATTWMEAMQKSATIPVANWQHDDEETPTVIATNK